MWLFTKYGFYSVAEPLEEESKHRGTSPVLLIRARRYEHLDALRERFPRQLGELTIWKNVGTDYQYRIIVSRSIWSDVVSKLTAEIDYSNFKDAVEELMPKSKYLQALHKVWVTVYKFGTKRMA